MKSLSVNIVKSLITIKVLSFIDCFLVYINFYSNCKYGKNGESRVIIVTFILF